MSISHLVHLIGKCHFRCSIQHTRFLRFMFKKPYIKYRHLKRRNIFQKNRICLKGDINSCVKHIELDDSIQCLCKDYFCTIVFKYLKYFFKL